MWFMSVRTKVCKKTCSSTMGRGKVTYLKATAGLSSMPFAQYAAAAVMHRCLARNAHRVAKGYECFFAPHALNYCCTHQPAFTDASLLTRIASILQAVKRTVNKAGANKGRFFFCCARQSLPACRSFFKWSDTTLSPFPCAAPRKHQ